MGHDTANRDAQVQAVLQHPQFQQLVRKKSRLSWTLSGLMLVLYFGFITLIAIEPKLLHASWSGGVVTVGIPLGISVILAAFVLCGVYVWRANGEFDRLTHDVVAQTHADTIRALVKEDRAS